jgi:hypothetical protein
MLHTNHGPWIIVSLTVLFALSGLLVVVPAQIRDDMYILSVPMQRDGATSLATMEKVIEQQQGHLQTAKGSNFLSAEWPDRSSVMIYPPFSLASPGPELRYICVRSQGGAKAFCEKLAQAYQKQAQTKGR